MVVISYAHLTDEEIIGMIVKERNSNPFGELYSRYVKMVLFKCQQFCPNAAAAEDLTHDIFVKLYTDLKKFEFKSKFSTWLFRVVNNYCIDHQRKISRGPIFVEEDENGYEFIEEEGSDDDLFEVHSEALSELIKRLKSQDRQVLLMKYLDGLKIEEISELTGLSSSAIKMKLKRSKEFILKEFSKQEKALNAN